ncbi:MAG: hypothetical protein A4E37_02205 [Methanoregulaceae archaeon PtaB.Bin056]|jgi:hypothetical protein|nr:MAG: hypothetical protein A4E37_02205 [Methanoregulaceae archaeon PtaB.Bin056]
MLLFLASSGMPVAAAIQEITYLGKITALDPLSGTITIRAESQYLCDYSRRDAACGFSPITPLQVVGTVPEEGIFNTFRNGDQVVATVMGASGGAWAGFAHVIPSSGKAQWVVTDLFGDPDTIPVPLAGDYEIEYSTTPDCNHCTGSVCKAQSAHVVLKSGGIPVLERTMTAGQSARYSGRNDGSSVSILYLTGEADAGTCTPAGSLAGMQPISNFILKVIQPIGQSATPGVVTHPTAEGIEPKVTPLSTPAPTQAPSGCILPLAALALVALWMRGRFP